jgi:hypothetical protein
MDTLYCVVFRGEIVDGENIDTVKKKLASMFKTDIQKIEKYFSGKNHTVKKDVNLETGEKIKAAFSKAGALCHLRKNEPQANALESEPKLELENKNVDVGVLKDKFSKKVSEVSAQMKPGINEVKEQASKTFSAASKSIKSDMEAGGLQALVKNKYFIVSTAACLILLVMVLGLFSGGGKPMPLTMENLYQLGDIWEARPYQISENQVEHFKSNKKAGLEFLIVEPIEEMGYDFEATIVDISDKYLSGNLSMELSMQAMVVLMVPAQMRDEAYQHGVISKDLKNRLDRVAEKMGV